MAGEAHNARPTSPVEDRSLTAKELVPIVYNDLRRMAGRFASGEAAHRTLQPTALVNEAYLRLAGGSEFSGKSRTQFLALAARCMRNVLVDASRRRDAVKRSGGRRQVTLNEQISLGQSSGSGAQLEVDVLDLEEALERIGQIKPRYLELIELRFYGGLELVEVAEILGVSRTIVTREWARARTWLAHYLTAYEA